jgi:hypothetical protein
MCSAHAVEENGHRYALNYAQKRKISNKLALGTVLYNKLVTLVLPDANNYTKSNNTQEV